MKKIAFILPGRGLKPIGGFKIAYQYADYFAEIGYEVHLIYNYTNIFSFNSKSYSLIYKMRVFLGFCLRKILCKLELSNWFNFKNEIHKDILFCYKPFFFKKYKNYDVIFATAVETAYVLNDLGYIPNKKKFYLIQDFENWKGNTDSFVYNSYKFPITKIVISKWLQERVKKTGNSATIIPNGLDFDYFKLTNPIENRKSIEVSMLYHLDDRKRCCDSISALEIVKKQIPDLHVTMFGVPQKPDNLPDWYSYYQTPDKKTHNFIYNNSAIFLAASEKEGWALPPAEAMQCGAALVCTDIGGFADYAISNKTALISPVYDINALAQNLIRLIKNNELRIKLAKTGYKFIQQFTTESANLKIKTLVEKTIES